MSKDIRSYFTVKSLSTSKKLKTEQEPVKKNGQRKRPVVLIDSDSDEEPNLTSKQSKTCETKDKKPAVEKCDSKSKYFKELKEVNVNEVFGSCPVKRDNSRNIVRKVVSKEVLEFHNDEDFEAELAKLDELAKPNNDCERTNGQTGINSSDEESGKVSKDKVENNNLLSDKRNKKTNGSLEIIDCDEVPRKKIKLESTNSSKDKSSDLKRKCETSPSKKKSPLKTSPKTGVSKDVVEKITTSKFFSNKISPPKSSPTRQNLPSNKIPHISPPVENKPHSTLNTHKSPESNFKRNEPKVATKHYNEETSVNKLNKQVSAEKTGKNDISDVEIKNEVPTHCKLWVERYKPSTTKQIIGQQGEKSCVNKLSVWLKNWHKNHSGNNKKLTKPSPWAKYDDGACFKAALLSGPPGVGKTTTAHLVSKELGFDVVEFNASDTRSKKLLHQEVSELLSTNSLSPFFTGKNEQVTKNHVLLMDEVDGMAGNEDRGGVQELIQLIKAARVPIICMCNDRNHPKIRSLSNYCFDLRFSKPRAEQIKGAMMSVCFKEKLKISPVDLTEIITSANQDIRLIINHLSMLSMETSSLANSSKHIKMGPWDITRKIFSEEEHKSMSIYDKCDLFFHDYSVTPLFVHENYLNAVPHKPEGKNKLKKMELFAKAARSLSLGDLTERRIRSHNAWGLLPVQAIFSSLVPGDVLEGHIGAQITFPAWFGKNSRQTKMSRLLQELTVHTRLKISGTKEAMNLDYLLPLERSILMPLVSQGTEGIPAALEVLNEYCLAREDLESFTELSSWPNSKNLFAEVESKVKAAFTRAYKKTCAPRPYAAVPIKKASKSSDIDSMEVDEEGASQDLEEDEEEESLEVDSMIMVKKKPATEKVDKDVPSTSKGSKNAKRGRKK